MSNEDESKVMQMAWSPTTSLAQPKRNQFHFTDNAGNQGFILYYSDNSVEIKKLIEHAYFYPGQRCANADSGRPRKSTTVWQYSAGSSQRDLRQGPHRAARCRRKRPGRHASNALRGGCCSIQPTAWSTGYPVPRQPSQTRPCDEPTSTRTRVNDAKTWRKSKQVTWPTTQCPPSQPT